MTFTLTATVPDRDVDITLDVAAGSTLALLGPNGSGKSTTLALTAGTLRPQDGRITLEGRTLTHVTEGRTRTWVPPHARQVALLAQEPLLFPHLTVRHNIAFGPRSQGVPRKEANAQAQRWLDQIGLAALADRRPGTLSGGQAQRVAVARALAARPRLLLLDEPLAALDVDVTPALRRSLQRMLTGQTAIITTHDVLDALLLADEVAVLEHGRVVERGATAQVLGRPRSAFTARLAGLNLVTGTWADGVMRTERGEVVVGAAPEAGLTPGTPVVAAFRPSAVRVETDQTAPAPNAFSGTITALEPHGDLVRVRTDRFAADLTPGTVARLELDPGAAVRLTVDAPEIVVYRA